MSNTLGLSARRIAWKRAIKVLSVVGINVGRTRFESTDMAWSREYHGTSDKRGIEFISQSFGGNNRRKLVAMNAGRDQQNRP